MSARERRLVRRASGGDVEAFRRLVDEHSELVRRVARRVLGREDVQDACQEVWMRAWQSIGGFRGESAFGTWLYRITVNTCLTHRGRESRREEREGGQDETPPRLEPAGGDADPETAALGAERR
ncbi:MAG: sigma-70 family RNA polymerase sigma factor, partial [Actinomycetota bacterium]